MDEVNIRNEEVVVVHPDLDLGSRSVADMGRIQIHQRLEGRLSFPSASLAN